MEGMKKRSVVNKMQQALEKTNPQLVQVYHCHRKFSTRRPSVRFLCMNGMPSWWISCIVWKAGSSVLLDWVTWMESSVYGKRNKVQCVDIMQMYFSHGVDAVQSSCTLFAEILPTICPSDLQCSFELPKATQP